MPATLADLLLSRPAQVEQLPQSQPQRRDWIENLLAADPRLSQMQKGRPGFDQFKNMLDDRSAHSLQDRLYSIPGVEWLLGRLGNVPMPPEKFDGWIDTGPLQSPEATRGRTIDPDRLDMQGKLRRRERGDF